MITKERKKIAQILNVKTRLSGYGILKGDSVLLLNDSQYVDIKGIVRDRKGKKIEECYEIHGFYGIPFLISFCTSRIDFEFTSTHMVCEYKGKKYKFVLGDMHVYTIEEDRNLLELLTNLNK